MLPSADAFATPAELKDANNFTLYSEYGSGKAQKVKFTNYYYWYIAGADRDGSLVLMCNPSDPLSNRTFDDNENMTRYSESGIRSSLDSFVTGGSFTSEEQALMNGPTIYTNAGSTADKLYLAYGEQYNDYITVGANSSGNLSSGIKIGIGNNGPDTSPFVNGGAGTFWLRNDVQSGMMVAAADVGASGIVGAYFPNSTSVTKVIPAFNLDLSSVLFASRADEAQVSASLATDFLVLRIKDNAGRIKSTAKVNEETISVTYDDSDGGSVYLYVQGNTADSSDWVKSVKIDSTCEYTFSDLGIGAENDLSKCQVWLETKDTDTHLVYAVYAEGGNHKGGSSGNSGSHDGSDSDCDHNFEWQTITAPTATTYGSEGEVCSKCGATRNIRAKSPLDDWVRMQINNAKPGDVLKLDFGPWSSYPLWMMQMIADKPTVTYIFNYTYQGNRYEVTIKPGDKFVLDCDWYGALKMPTMFDTVVTKM